MAEGHTLQHCTIPLDLASGSGLANAAIAFLVQQGSNIVNALTGST